MKFIVKIDSNEVILDEARLAQLTELLIGSEKFVQQYVGSKKGADGSNYIQMVRKFEPRTELPIKPLHDGVYTTLKLRTEAYDETN